MQIGERDQSLLNHILKYCEEIEQFVVRFGDSRDAFENDKAYRGACSLDILQIGELSANLTEDFKQKTPPEEIVLAKKYKAEYEGRNSK